MGGQAGQPRVRPAVPDDAAAIRMVQAETWMATYPNEALGITREGLRRHLEGSAGEKIAERVSGIRERIDSAVSGSARGRDFVAVLDGEIVGFTAPFIEPGGRRRVGALYVLPAAQGRGIGHLLMAENLAWHGADQDVYLHVAAYNERAKKFYERHGFVVAGEAAQDEGATIDGRIIPEQEMLRRGKPNTEVPQVRKTGE
jgi:ribosomal protein S18 acetylase RimI-like enzyme